jgi:hypothetical protein
MALKYAVILFNSGKIKMQYNVVGSTGTCDSSVTIGIQSHGAVGSAALQYCSGTLGTNFVGPHPAAGRAMRRRSCVTVEKRVGFISQPVSRFENDNFSVCS